MTSRPLSGVLLLFVGAACSSSDDPNSVADGGSSSIGGIPLNEGREYLGFRCCAVPK